jgi:hypothetical protein
MSDEVEITIQLSDPQWKGFCELVRQTKEDPGLLEHNPEGLPLNQVTRHLVNLVHDSDSLSQCWHPGHRVWDALCALVTAADPVLPEMPRKEYPEPTPEQLREHEEQERKTAEAMIGTRVRLNAGWPPSRRATAYRVVGPVEYHTQPSGGGHANVMLEGDGEFGNKRVGIGHLEEAERRRGGERRNGERRKSDQ